LPTTPLPSQRDEEEKWTKGQTNGLRYQQFNKTTNEILLLLIVIKIIMILQNRLCTIHRSHHVITYSQPVPRQLTRNSDHLDFANFAKSMKKTKLLDKRGFEPSEMRESYPCTSPH